MSNCENTTLITAGLVAALPLIPVGHYLCFGWWAKKQQIVGLLSDKSIGFYRQVFCPTSDFKDRAGFAEDYDARYGLRLFWGPVLAFAIALLFLTYLSVSWVFSHDWFGASEGTAKIAIMSLAGGYVWVTYDLIDRARQNDIVTSDINRATLRLLVALPFGFAISAFAGVVTGSAVTLSTGALAFFVGAFPTDTLLKFMRRTAAIPLKLDADSSEDSVQQLTRINRISVPIAERLIDEGVKTNLQLAYADPVALTIKSGMSFSFILICCAHAIVRVYFNDDRMKVVEKFGLLTGFEVKTLHDRLLSCDKIKDEAAIADRPARDQTSAEAAAQRQVENLAKELLLDVDSTRSILEQIADDPYTKFIWWMWPDISEPKKPNCGPQNNGADKPPGAAAGTATITLQETG